MHVTTTILALMLSSTPVHTTGAEQPIAAAAASRTLEAGQFVWQPEMATSGAVEVVVSIPQQRAYVYRGGTLIGYTTVSTGRPGHRTPTGRFEILEKRREHYSNLYNNAPMPFMQRLTWGGIALHAGHIPGTPASHGCVRLPLEFSRLLFGVTQRGSTVHIIDASPTADTALSLARGEQQPVPAAPAPLAAPAPVVVAVAS